MSNIITPVKGALTSPFGTFFSDRFLNSFFDAAPIYGTISRQRRNPLVPRYNVTESENGFLISVAAPGVAKDNINVNTDSNTLTITYTQEENTDTSFACSSFRRSWRLPEGTDIDNITATCENGILTLSIPAADAGSYTRTIKIK